MYFSDYTHDEKVTIAKQLKEHSLEAALTDFNKLKKAVDTDINSIKPLSPIGLTSIENFVHIEVLSTKANHGISFYDFWFHREFYMNRDASTKKLIQSIQTNKPYLTEIKVAKQVFNLYYGTISIFRPTNAARLYTKFQPKCVLDFTMGWGGRLLGAAITNVSKYIGIDSNTRLEEPYKNMVNHLLKDLPIEVDLRFQDALTIDYSVLDYDMVFTSPPFYNKELYHNQHVYKLNENWDKDFYIPIFQKTWQYLKPGGYYCLNIPTNLYNKICIPILGEACEQLELKKYSRVLPKKDTQKQTNVGQKYKEFIYIWKKEG